jgi:hypothetical protein
MGYLYIFVKCRVIKKAPVRYMSSPLLVSRMRRLTIWSELLKIVVRRNVGHIIRHIYANLRYRKLLIPIFASLIENDRLILQHNIVD